MRHGGLELHSWKDRERLVSGSLGVRTSDGSAAGSAAQQNVDSGGLCAVGRRERTATGNAGLEEKPAFALTISIILHHDFALEPSV